MNTNRFTNTCLVVVICLLGLIALRLNSAPVYAAKKFRYEVVPITEQISSQTVTVQVDKETQAGWELVAAPIWNVDLSNGARGYLIFRR